MLAARSRGAERQPDAGAGELVAVPQPIRLRHG